MGNDNDDNNTTYIFLIPTMATGDVALIYDESLTIIGQRKNKLRAATYNSSN